MPDDSVPIQGEHLEGEAYRPPQQVIATTDGAGIASHAGSGALIELADRLGQTAALSAGKGGYATVTAALQWLPQRPAQTVWRWLRGQRIQADGVEHERWDHAASVAPGSGDV